MFKGRAQPQEGWDARTFANRVKKGGGNDAEQLAGKHGGLYYMQDPQTVTTHDGKKRKFPPDPFTRQIKVGAAGIQGVNDHNKDFNKGPAQEKANSKTNSIVDRLHMYFGHRGGMPMFLNMFRAMSAGKKRVYQAEKAMEDELESVARDEKDDKNPAIKVAPAYAYNPVTKQHEPAKGHHAEWFYVNDREKVNYDGKEMTPNQLVVAAMQKSVLPDKQHGGPKTDELVEVKHGKTKITGGSTEHPVKRKAEEEPEYENEAAPKRRSKRLSVS
tara:strand:+ start:1106 stop:1921 length:816 start_codon:yes stop_codon:yes gene_type:complete